MKAPLILFFNEFGKQMPGRFENHPGNYRLSCDLSDLPQASVVLVNIPKLLSRREKVKVVLHLEVIHPLHLP